MRTIKFRAWDKDQNCWDIEPWDYSMFDTVTNRINSIFSNSPELIFMQFTGLLDKNDKEIYEGDIIRLYPTGELTEVQFAEQDIGHDFQGVGFFTREKDGSQGNIYGGNYVEVISNIYQNPELLIK